MKLIKFTPQARDELRIVHKRIQGGPKSRQSVDMALRRGPEAISQTLEHRMVN